MRLQAGLRAWTQVLLGQAEDKAEVDMDTDAPQVSHKPGGEPKIKVSVGWEDCSESPGFDFNPQHIVTPENCGEGAIVIPSPSVPEHL